MPRALIAKLRPNGPWRVGPSTGDRLRVDRILHSDALYSAVTLALFELGQGEAWLEATAQHAAGSQVRLSSCFPFVDDVLFLAPPETHWPPPASLKIRWEGARYVPAAAAAQLLNDKPLVEEHYVVDGVSECLLPVMRNVPMPAPFRVAIRSRAAVDRLGAGVEPHRAACVEFTKGAGIWMAFAFENAEASRTWAAALKGAIRLIADSGLGGERSSGWGRFEQPEFVEGDLAQNLFSGRYRPPHEIEGHWLLSLFSPGADDQVNWQQGSYRVVTRTGRVAGSGEGKRANQMIAEGSVLVSAEPLRGVARNVAPEGFAHPVYRAGFALAIPIGKSRPPQPPKPVRQQQEPAPPPPVVEEVEIPVQLEEPEVVPEPQAVEVADAVEQPPVPVIVVEEPEPPVYKPIEIVRATYELKPIEVIRADVDLKPIEILREEVPPHPEPAKEEGEEQK